jgi:hypothetical protein
MFVAEQQLGTFAPGRCEGLKVRVRCNSKVVFKQISGDCGFIWLAEKVTVVKDKPYFVALQTSVAVV